MLSLCRRDGGEEAKGRGEEVEKKLTYV